MGETVEETVRRELKQDDDEVVELKWFDVDNLPNNINTPVDKAILEGIDKVI